MTAAAVLTLNVAACAEETLPEGAIESGQESFLLETVAGGLEHPWALAFLPDQSFLVGERGGTLWHISEDGQTKTAITGLPPNLRAAGQGGLFDIMPAPDFSRSNTLYIAYTGEADNKNNTELARATLNLENHTLSDVSTLFAAAPKVSGNNHYGGKLLSGPDGKIYLTLGERFNYLDRVQKPDNHLGTIIRLNRDGSVPEDNPFAADGGAKPPEVYTWGHRNVQGIAWRPGTDDIWTHEHGPKGGDEINILSPGVNYGWPAITYGVDYSGFPVSDKTEAEGMAQPLLHWTPSIAPSGMAFYDGDKFPEWKGDLFIGALSGMHLRRLELDGDTVTEQEVLLKDTGRIRDVRSGPDGYLYLLTDDTDGALLRLKPVR